MLPKSYTLIVNWTGAYFDRLSTTQNPRPLQSSRACHSLYRVSCTRISVYTRFNLIYTSYVVAIANKILMKSYLVIDEIVSLQSSPSFSKYTRLRQILLISLFGLDLILNTHSQPALHEFSGLSAISHVLVF